MFGTPERMQAAVTTQASPALGAIRRAESVNPPGERSPFRERNGNISAHRVAGLRVGNLLLNLGRILGEFQPAAGDDGKFYTIGSTSTLT